MWRPSGRVKNGKASNDQRPLLPLHIESISKFSWSTFRIYPEHKHLPPPDPCYSLLISVLTSALAPNPMVSSHAHLSIKIGPCVIWFLCQPIFHYQGHIKFTVFCWLFLCWNVLSKVLIVIDSWGFLHRQSGRLGTGSFYFFLSNL